MAQKNKTNRAKGFFFLVNWPFAFGWKHFSSWVLIRKDWFWFRGKEALTNPLRSRFESNILVPHMKSFFAFSTALVNRTVYGSATSISISSSYFLSFFLGLGKKFFHFPSGPSLSLLTDWSAIVWKMNWIIGREEFCSFAFLHLLFVENSCFFFFLWGLCYKALRIFFYLKKFK